MILQISSFGYIHTFISSSFVILAWDASSGTASARLETNVEFSVSTTSRHDIFFCCHEHAAHTSWIHSWVTSHPTFLTAYLLLQLCPEMILEASHPHRLFSHSGNNISQMSKCGKHDMQTLQPNITLPYACFQFFFPPEKRICIVLNLYLCVRIKP